MFAGGSTKNNIGYLFRGYDLIKGNPLRTGKKDQNSDHGFRGAIFEATYQEGKKTADQRFKEPDHVDISSKESCSVNAKSETIFTQQQYQNDLSTHVSVSGEGSIEVVTAKFSASVDYSETSKKLKSNTKAIIRTTASCLDYDARIELNDPPKFTENFKNKLKDLTSGDDSDYFDLLDQFGTHFLKEMESGSRYTVIQDISKSSREDLDRKGVDVNTVAEASVAGLFGGSREIGVKTSKENIQKFNESIEKTVISLVGSSPPKDGM